MIVIAATNRPDVLDPALRARPLRPTARWWCCPDIRGREQILNVHMRKVPIAVDVKPEIIARGTPGFSGAGSGQPGQRSGVFAARRNKRLVDMEDFESARTKS